MSTADLHFYTGNESGEWGEAYGIANFVFNLQDEEFTYLYEIKDDRDAYRDETYLGDIRLRISHIVQYAPVEFNFYAHEIDFIGF